MPQAVGTTGVKRPANYSNCPLKKRPIKYDHVEADYSSDSSDHNGPFIHHDSDSSEPENLSTKPEDLRLANTEAKLSSSVSPASAVQKLSKDVETGTKPKPSLNLMPTATRTDKVNQLLHSQILGNSVRSSGPPPHLNYGPSESLHLQPSPSASTSSSVRHLPIPPPPPLKVFASNHLNGNGRPLEPISFNPQVASSNANVSGWSSAVPHYLPFNFMPPASTNVLGHGHHGSRQHSHPQSHVPSHGHSPNSFSPLPPAKLASSYPFYHHHQFVHQPHHQSHLAPHRNHLKGEIGSPPHVSPPLSTEPSYPPTSLRQETTHHQQRHYPAEEFTKFNLHHHQYSVQISPKEVKRETREIQHKRERDGLVINFTRSPQSKEIKLNSSLRNHSHSEVVNRSRSLSSGSCSDRSSPIPDSSSLSPCSTTGNSVTSTITPTNVNGSIRYQCPDCSKSYSTFSGLSKHLQFHCASQNKKSFICKFCDKVYVSLGALKMHIRTHTLPCKCTICGKAFSRPWLLQGHIRTHTGEKPFSCEFCHRAFADRSNLRAHLQTHSEVKKYSCQSCSKTFSRTSLLAKHKDSGCGHGSA